MWTRRSPASPVSPDDQADLKALVAAAREPDLARRATRLGETLAVDQFSFVAMEMMAAHWDGYARNRNNYRLYNHPAVNKMVFFPPAWINSSAIRTGPSSTAWAASSPAASGSCRNQAPIP